MKIVSWNIRHGGSASRLDAIVTTLENHDADTIALGWTDLWRSRHAESREFTWFSTAGNGFRLDYAFASPALASALVEARHSHAEREAKISDHSSLVIELNLKCKSGRAA